MNELKYAETIAYSSKETLYFTYKCAKQMRDKPGDYVECGVAAGAQIIALLAGAPDKTVWAFDSFEGIPLPTNRDYDRPGIRPMTNSERHCLPNPGEQVLESSGVTAVTVDNFLEHIKLSDVKANRLQIVKGWFENTMPVNSVGDISILRLDGDLYSSTLSCLVGLFSKVIEGGIVIIDDWQLQGCREACIDYFNSIKYYPKYQFISTIAYFYK